MANKVKTLCIFGTRPEAIKMAPVIKELQRNNKIFKTIICVTAQHRHMLDQVLSLFSIKPDLDLNLMQPNQSLDSLSSRAVLILGKTIREIKPHLIIVQGDTTTAMIAALASFYQKIPVAHVEAGLRTRDIYNPFPEEINRRIISVLCAYNFVPTKNSLVNLLKEGVQKKNIFLTGNTAVDALKMIASKRLKINFPFLKYGDKKLILVTAHRRENFGKPLKNICFSLKKIAQRNQGVEIVYPVHLNPNVKNTVFRILKHVKRVHLIKPVDYNKLVHLLKRSHFILTDSGGIQEEAPTFGKPVLVMRKETERPEGIEAGVAKLVGTTTDKIIKESELLLNNRLEYKKMSKAISPYGDGKAAKRIIEILKKKILIGEL